VENAGGRNLEKRKKRLRRIFVCNVNEVTTEGKSPDFVLVIPYRLGHEATMSHKQNYVGEDKKWLHNFGTEALGGLRVW